MNERIRLLRETLGLSRSSFGDKLGISGDVVNNLERGRIEIKDERIKLICTTFGINEEWLRFGDGEMKISLSRNEEIFEFANEIMSEMDVSFKKRLITALSKLNEKNWETLEKIAEELLKK